MSHDYLIKTLHIRIGKRKNENSNSGTIFPLVLGLRDPKNKYMKKKIENRKKTKSENAENSYTPSIYFH